MHFGWETYAYRHELSSRVRVCVSSLSLSLSLSYSGTWWFSLSLFDFMFYRLHSFCLCYSYLLTDPPSAPIISGYVEGSIIPAGSVQKLVCISSGGNPLATLTWYKNDKKVSFWLALSFVCIMCLATKRALARSIVVLSLAMPSDLDVWVRERKSTSLLALDHELNALASIQNT